MIHVIAIITAKPGKRDEILATSAPTCPPSTPKKAASSTAPRSTPTRRVPDAVWRRHVRGDREVGERRRAQGPCRGAAHGRLRRQDQGHDRQPHHPHPHPGRLIVKHIRQSVELSRPSAIGARSPLFRSPT